jgi:SAM-dependent methyltransferase
MIFTFTTETISTYKRFGVPDQLVNTIFVLLVVLLFAPYSGGFDFGIFKVPDFSLAIKQSLKWIAPSSFFVFLLLFFPFWKPDTGNGYETQDKAVNSDSTYILQSTPDIILNELIINTVNINGIKIVSGFDINDLKKRIKIFNSRLSLEEITVLVESAREKAFTSKYADKWEDDEKLININEFEIEGISEWQTYLNNFLPKLGILVSDLKNMKVLDVGMGNAHASKVFLDNCADLTGVDISLRALENARAVLRNAKLQVGSAENLNTINSFSVDLYISLRTYQSTLFDIKESLHEAYRVLTQGGGIIISIPIMYIKKDNGKFRILKGLIPSNSDEPKLEYAMKISEKVENYLNILGFKDVEICTDSPFEIYIGARK